MAGSGWQVDGDGLQPGRYDLFVGSPDPAQHSLTALTVHGSTFQTHRDGPADVESVALLRYDAARVFPLPGSGG
jgi:hypothetical protein